MVRIYLIAAALAWTPYGLFLMFSPGALEGIAGVSAVHGAGTTELRAMYGGLQAAIGLLCVAALLRDRFAVPVLAVSAVLCGGLFTGRVVGALSDAGALDGYNIGTLAFELFASTSAAWLATRPAAVQ
jgi:hypothetical protein